MEVRESILKALSEENGITHTLKCLKNQGQSKSNQETYLQKSLIHQTFIQKDYMPDSKPKDTIISDLKEYYSIKVDR